VENQLVLIEVSNPTKQQLHIRFVDQKPYSNDGIQQVIDYVCEWLDLNTDLDSFYETAQIDPILSPLIKRYYGLRIVGIPDLFEALCWAVIGQQINLTFAYTLKRRFVEHFGQPYEWNGRKFWLFPNPDQFQEKSIPLLRELQFTTKKAEYIVGIAKEIREERISKASMIKNFQHAEKQLLAVRGVGPWTAHYAMMRCFRNPSSFPIGDVGLHHALKFILSRENKPKVEEIREIFEPWKNWEAYAVFYLWRSLEDV
jgi:DNA-3-methyladenine glycosylase II